MKYNRSISFDQELWSKIDKLKGDISRSRFLSKVIAEGLKPLENRSK